MKSIPTNLCFLFLLLALFSNQIRAQTGGDAIIYPEEKGTLIDAFFYDLKQWAGAVNSESKANDLFVTDGMNGVRISIYGNNSKPAHPSAGVVVESEYTGLISSINLAKTTRGTSGLTIFASKKLEGQDSFPDWVKDEDGIIPEQYATLLADFIRYMNSKGIEIDVLGIDNERVYNEGNMTPQKHKETVDFLKAFSVSDQFTMPLIIGHEDYGPNKNDWMKTLSENDWLDRIDLYGTHYYPQYRPKSKLITDLSYAGDKPFWSTEPHWDNKSEQDQLAIAEQAMCALWDQTDLGMSGVMWWNYELTSHRGYMMRNATVPLLDSQPIDMDDIDGRDISTLGKLQTRAFRKGDQITVYAINMSETLDYPNYGFNLNSGTINGTVAFKQWTDESATIGNSGSANLISDTKFELNLPARSITSFTFNLGTVTGTTSVSSTSTIFVFPNPVSDILSIFGLQAGSTYAVYNLNGEKILEGETTQLNVANLNTGIYILKTTDGKILKFIKA
ncbi:T9SS type A sorting domain-containing protein [Mangrovibacterium sp.]|uniref:T9SS type A sorting domain-containing protein n=1 Tax=Mangrovibacterium sp. TaxID=1961364 RepID=UPI0035649AC0